MIPFEGSEKERGWAKYVLEGAKVWRLHGNSRNQQQ